MPVYEIRWSRKAVNYLKRLELATRKRIVEAIETLASDPSNQNLDVKPMQGRPVFCKRKMHVFATEDLTAPDLHFCC